MSDTKTKKENPVSNEQVVYEDEKAKFKITKFDFTIQKGKDEGKVLNFIKLSKAKKVFSKEFNTYVEKDSYITLSAEVFQNLATAIKEDM